VWDGKIGYYPHKSWPSLFCINSVQFGTPFTILQWCILILRFLQHLLDRSDMLPLWIEIEFFCYISHVLCLRPILFLIWTPYLQASEAPHYVVFSVMLAAYICRSMNILCSKFHVVVYTMHSNQVIYLKYCSNNAHYRYVPYKDVSVNDGPHIRRWSHYNII